MPKYAKDHFYKQFDKYPEGQPRFEACAQHAAYLLQRLYETSEREYEILVTIRNALTAGENPVKIALAIQMHLEDEHGDEHSTRLGPFLSDLKVDCE